jgi:flagellar biosynthesis chaperone FliJ
MTPLNELHKTRRAAQGALEHATTSLNNGRHIHADKMQRLKEFESHYEASIAAQAARMAEDIANGEVTVTSGPPESLLNQKLSSWRHQTKVTAQALATLETDHAKRQAELQAAEAAVVQAVEILFHEEDVAAARAVLHLLDEASRLGTAVFHSAVSSELNGRMPPPQEVLDVIQRLETPIIDRRNIPINLMRQGDTVEAARRATRRTALIAGEANKEATPA